MNKPIRQVFSTLFEPMARVLPHAWLNKACGQPAILPVYHLVADEPVPHISHLYNVRSSADFSKDLDYLLQYYQPTDTLSFVQSEAYKGKSKACVVSFDDGLRSFYDVAAPILLAKGVSATNFLNSAFIDNRALFYRYKVSLLIEQLFDHVRDLAPTAPVSRTKPQALPEYTRQRLQLVPAHLREQTLAHVHALRALGYEDTTKIDDLIKAWGLDIEAYLKKEQPYLTSQQITKLITQGFQFGAHSIDHPTYYTLSLEEQIRQTEVSIRAISQQFHLDYKVFAFPFTDFGVEAEFYDAIIKSGKSAATFGVAGIKQSAFDKHIQRLAFENSFKDARSIVHTELLYRMVNRS